MADSLSEDLAALRIDRGSPSGGGAGGGAFVKVVAYVVVIAGATLAGWLFLVPALAAKLFRPEVSFTEIARVSPAQASVDLTATGYVVPERVAKIAPKVLGKITKMNVREGDVARTGQTLFEMDAQDEHAAIASAQARARSAQAKVAAARAAMLELKQQIDRDRALAATGSIAAATVDDMQARLASMNEQANAADIEARAAQAEVATLGVGLHDLVVRAPIDGVVVGKPPELGDLVTPTPDGAFQLVDLDTMVIEVDVPEARLGQAKPGRPCEIVLDAYPDARRRGKVLVITPRVNRSKATVVVKVAFSDDAAGALPEMSARVSFLTRELDAAAMKEAPKTVVPANAIADRAGQKAVFVVDGEKVRLKPIVLGAPFADGFVLENGPPSGTKVVRDPAPTLSDGQAVKEKDQG